MLRGDGLQDYGMHCAWALARAHAGAGDAGAIAAYVGCGYAFVDAVTAFAIAYADQATKDHAAFVAAAPHLLQQPPQLLRRKPEVVEDRSERPRRKIAFRVNRDARRAAVPFDTNVRAALANDNAAEGEKRAEKPAAGDDRKSRRHRRSRATPLVRLR